MSLLKGFKPLPTELTNIYKELWDQAKSHTSLDGLGRLIDSKRPSETELIKEFRKRNQRKITLVEFRAFCNMIAMIFTNSGMTTIVSDVLNEYLETSPFRVNYKDYDLNNWFFNCAFPKSCEDANGVFLVYPKKDDYADVLTKNTPQIKFFNSDQYKGTVNYTLNEVVIDGEPDQGDEYMYFAIEILSNGVSVTNMYEHWLVSKDKYIILKDVKGKPQPELQWWFQHKAGSFPLVSPPSEDITYGKYEVRHSLASGMFEFWDEGLTRFSDAQAIANKADFPTLIIPQIECKAPGCFQGYLKDHTAENPKPCPSCKGTKIDLMNSPFTSISIPNSNGLTETKGIVPFWMSPDVAIVNNSFAKAMELLELGRNKGGMVTVETQNTESGVARSIRFQSKQELLGSIAGKTKMFLESILFYIEILLVNEETKRKMPVVIFKSNLNVKDEESMRLEAMEAPLADRPASFMVWIGEKYKGNHDYIRAFSIALDICPLITMNQDELISAMLVYSELYFFMKDSIVNVLTKLIAADPNKDIEETRIADDILAQQAIDIITKRYELMKPPTQPIPVITYGQRGQATGTP